MVLGRNLISALMQVGRGRLRHKGVQAKVVEFLREDRHGQTCSLPIIDLQVELAERVKAFELRIALKWRQTLNRRAHEAVFERLCKRKLVFYDRARKSNTRRKSADSD